MRSPKSIGSQPAKLPDTPFFREPSSLKSSHLHELGEGNAGTGHPVPISFSKLGLLPFPTCSHPKSLKIEVLPLISQFASVSNKELDASGTPLDD